MDTIVIGVGMCDIGELLSMAMPYFKRLDTAGDETIVAIGHKS